LLYDSKNSLIINEENSVYVEVFDHQQANKNLHIDNSSGDMITFFSNIKYGNNKIIKGTKHYLKININNILNSNLPKSLI
jgi:hypothetical protein